MALPEAFTNGPPPRLVTMRELHLDTPAIIEEMADTQIPVIVTRHGRFVALIEPLDE
jgi:hypothetical protein